MQETIALIVFAAAVYISCTCITKCLPCYCETIVTETNVVIIILLALCNLCIDLQDT